MLTSGWVQLRTKLGLLPHQLAMMMVGYNLHLFYHHTEWGRENDLYDIGSMNRFAGLRLGTSSVRSERIRFPPSAVKASSVRALKVRIHMRSAVQEG